MSRLSNKQLRIIAMVLMFVGVALRGFAEQPVIIQVLSYLALLLGPSILIYRYRKS
ncbi:MAG: hypothetical protein ACKVKP_11490 [Acidimicrobiales bacterium]|jgi:hypothetical protein